MTDAQTLYRDGVAAIREQKDFAEGRRLLTQSLRLNPANDMAWLWLARTISDLDKQRQCIERALAINPENRHALSLKQQMEARANGHLPPVTVTSPRQTLTPNAEKRLDEYLDRAQKLLAEDDVQGAIEQWVTVLKIQPDHEVALGNAVRYLSRLKYFDDAKELVWRALDSGTTHPSIYLTAIDFLKRDGQHVEADDLRRKLARLPSASETIVSDITDYFIRGGQLQDAQDILDQAIQSHPRSQKLLIKRADLHLEMGQESEARKVYEQAASMGMRTADGKLADTRLNQFAPALTDQERGSTLLALREAAGISLFYLLMGWQDAGLNLLNLGAPRWAGVALGFIGGYLLITATSSPQQRPLAGWLGGKVPETTDESEASALPILPFEARLLLGISGLVVLTLAFYLVFSTAIGLLTTSDPQPFYIPSMDEIFEFE